MKPKIRASIVKTPGPISIANGASWGSLGVLTTGPKKGLINTRPATATTSMAERTAATKSPVCHIGACNSDSSNSSLATNPNSGGSPARDKAASPVITAVFGMLCLRPPIRVMSLVPVSWSSAPASINKAPLYSEWATRKQMKAVMASSVPTPTSMVRVPSAITVE